VSGAFNTCRINRNVDVTSHFYTKKVQLQIDDATGIRVRGVLPAR